VTNFTTENVKHISKLSNLPLSEAEESALAEAFSKTLEYIKILDELDTADLVPTYQVTGLVNVFQSPNARTTLIPAEALKNAKGIIKDKFSTQAVFDR